MAANLYKQFNNIFRANEGLINELKENILLDNRFELRDNNKLFFLPLNVEVINKEDIDEKLDTIYNTNDGMVNAVTAFYKLVRQKYLNITRDEIADYLKSKTEYQLNLKKNRTSAPIVTLYPNKTWGIDLVDNNKRIINGYRYIVTVVDVFSKKCWLRKTTNKQPTTIRNALQSIIQETGISPKMILCDNGSELKEEFATFCSNNNIKIINTRSNSPQANGIVENKNKQVRRLLNQFMLRHNTPDWTVYLQATQDNLNNKYNSSIKASPNQIWSNTNNKYADINAEAEEKQEVYRNNREKINNFREKDRFAVGDKVRIKMTSLFANMRMMEKSGIGKHIAVYYSPSLYTIFKVTPRQSRNNAERYQYKLTNENGQILSKATDATKAHIFYATDLLLVPNGVNDATISNDRALILNKSQRTNNDVNGV